MDGWTWSIGGMKLTGKAEVLGRKLATSLATKSVHPTHCPPKVYACLIVHQNCPPDSLSTKILHVTHCPTKLATCLIVHQNWPTASVSTKTVHLHLCPSNLSTCPFVHQKLPPASLSTKRKIEVILNSYNKHNSVWCTVPFTNEYFQTQIQTKSWH